MTDKFSKAGVPPNDREIAQNAILKLVRALARQAAREDYERATQDLRKPRKRALKPPQK
jgi:ubiquitin